VSLQDCRCSWPCDCGSPAVLAQGQLDRAIITLADVLRRQHLAAVRDRLAPGDAAMTFLPWRSLQDSERARWRGEARRAVKDGPQV
jgi:hypothetical protein